MNEMQSMTIKATGKRYDSFACRTASNALTDTLTGTTVSTDMVSPIDHEVGCQIYNKNLCGMGSPGRDYNVESMFISRTAEGITVRGRTNKEGYISLSSVGEDSYTKRFEVWIERGQSYVASISDVVGNFNAQITFTQYSADGQIIGQDGGLAEGITASKRTTTFTPNSNYSRTLAVIHIYIAENVDYDFTIKFQLEKGTTVTPFTPHISDFSAVKVYQMGKNAIVPNVKSGSMAGVQYTVNDDGGVHVKGTAASDGVGSFFNLNYVKDSLSIRPGEYVLSGGGTNVRVEVYDKGRPGISVIRSEEKGVSIPGNATQTYSRVYVSPGATVDETVYPMVRFSVYDSKFEKGVPAMQYTSSADGIVSGMTSLSPNMTILTDTEGVIIKAIYNMDANKVIANISDKNQTSANAVTDTLVGAIVSTDLVSPIEHDIACKVNSKNMAFKSRFPKNLGAEDLTIERLSDSIRVSGKQTGGKASIFILSEKDRLRIHKGETYTASIEFTGNLGNATILGEHYTLDGTYIRGLTEYLMASKKSSTFTPNAEQEETLFVAYISLPDGATVDFTLKFQLERGKTATSFTPYFDDFAKVMVTQSRLDGTEANLFTPAVDGTVSGMESISPGMKLSVDNPNVVIEATYNMDTNKVISRLSDRISALEKYHAEI